METKNTPPFDPGIRLILEEIRDLREEAADDRKQAADDRRQAANDRKQFAAEAAADRAAMRDFMDRADARHQKREKEISETLLLVYRTGEKIVQKQTQHSRLLERILLTLKVSSNGRPGRGNGRD